MTTHPTTSRFDDRRSVSRLMLPRTAVRIKSRVFRRGSHRRQQAVLRFEVREEISPNLGVAELPEHPVGEVVVDGQERRNHPGGCGRGGGQ